MLLAQEGIHDDGASAFHPDTLPTIVEEPICTPAVYFSPYDNVETVVLRELGVAKKSIHASLYGIDNQQIADVLEAKAKAGVEVEIGEDKLQASGKHDLHAELMKAGVKVVVKPKGVLEHNKFAIIDGSTVVMGSWNWSKSAQKQDNSDVIFKYCPTIALEFETAFDRIIKRDKP